MEQQIYKSAFFISLPDGYNIKENPGPDFNVYYFLPLAKSPYRTAGYYVGGHPRSFYNNDDYRFVRVLYSPLFHLLPEWRVYLKDDIYYAETMIELAPFEIVHAFVNAETLGALEKWLKVFNSLRKEGLVPKEYPGIKNGIVTLYELKTENLEVIVNAYFEKDALVIDGHDSGKRVKEMFGAGEYDYKVTVPDEILPALCKGLNRREGGKEYILGDIARLFNGKEGFFRFRSFLDNNQITYDYLSWS